MWDNPKARTAPRTRPIDETGIFNDGTDYCRTADFGHFDESTYDRTMPFSHRRREPWTFEEYGELLSPKTDLNTAARATAQIKAEILGHPGDRFNPFVYDALKTFPPVVKKVNKLRSKYPLPDPNVPQNEQEPIVVSQGDLEKSYKIACDIFKSAKDSEKLWIEDLWREKFVGANRVADIFEKLWSEEHHLGFYGIHYVVYRCCFPLADSFMTYDEWTRWAAAVDNANAE